MKKLLIPIALSFLLSACGKNADECTETNTKNCPPGSKEKKAEGAKKLEGTSDSSGYLK